MDTKTRTLIATIKRLALKLIDFINKQPEGYLSGTRRFDVNVIVKWVRLVIPMMRKAIDGIEQPLWKANWLSRIEDIRIMQQDAIVDGRTGTLKNLFTH